jgi:hypothetical protein
MIESIAARRLEHLSITSPIRGSSVVELVERFGAVQAQDYAAAKWAVGIRLSGARGADVDRAFDEGRLLRTHVMRPTWQFVTPATIGWLLELTAPRVHQACAFLNRYVGLDAATRTRSRRIIRAALRGQRYLTREELASALERGGVTARGMRLAAIVIAAELDAVVCSGPRRDRRFTYALFEERVTGARPMPRRRALEELARRYFTTHGPATARDFSWWSGLTMASAREAVEMLPALRRESVDGKTYWSLPVRSRPGTAASLHLLPAFDEYIVGYRDRDAVPYKWPMAGGARAFLGTVFAGAEFVGSWRRVEKRDAAAIEVRLLRTLTPRERRSLEAQVERHAAFRGEPVPRLVVT